MNAKCFVILFVAVSVGWLAPKVRAQGFAGLGTDAQGFSVPQRGHQLSFPADHGPHPDYRIEWWYVTANLQGDDGKRYGAQWTLFRSALGPVERRGFADPQIWIGHAALTTSTRQLVAEKFGRGGVGQAGVTLAPFRAWIDDWEMKGAPAAPGADLLSTLTLRAAGEGFSFSLGLTTKKPLVLQGDHGYSPKSAEGQASYYYSQPFFDVDGTIAINDSRIKVRGQAWLDREWSSQPLSSQQTGWDWFSLHLDNGEKVMAFRLRDQQAGFMSVTWISPDGQPEPLPAGSITLNPARQAWVNGRQIPVAWHLRIPDKDLDIMTEPLNDQSWMSTFTPYWEGPIAVKGTRSGQGYLEMTGY
ncbi:lipocalin-like domain-containing protein [Rhizobium sp. BK418]|uniref:lipocalin-like domain-containing protein n=1 Tax=Rhizobium sp. BK418 TaxID=2512120 RepID=UPI00104735DA|nr:lipocalin-like domain-containing protein [Rhizobium sp. BK418]TCR96375.1 putative secreted hydrolase [Rhizobium sp. BK418]